MSQTTEKTFSLSWITGRGASVIALAGFMMVSIYATAMGFQDLRLANLDKAALGWRESLPVWGMTVFVILAMVAALNAALGVGFSHDASGVEKKRRGLRVLAGFFYLFFAFWSVGFGYGFFWKELAGQEYTQTQFKSAIESVSNSVARSTEALVAVETAVEDAADTARARALIEADQGGTCANRPDSAAGDGPLTRARFAFADRAQALREDVDASWTSQLAEDRRVLAARIDALSQGEAPQSALNDDGPEAQLLRQLAMASELESAERRALFARVFDDARAFTAKTNGLRARQAPAFAARLNALASEVGPDPQSPGRPNPARAEDPSYCWDTVLTDKLSAGADLLRGLEDMPSPEFEFTEGPKATRAAFFNLAASVTSLPSRLLKSIFKKGERDEKDAGLEQRENINSSSTFGEKDFIALFASIAVDAGILFLTLVRAAMERKGDMRERRWPKRFDLADLARIANRADHRHVVETAEEMEEGDIDVLAAPPKPESQKALKTDVQDAHFEELPDDGGKAPKN